MKIQLLLILLVLLVFLIVIILINKHVLNNSKEYYDAKIYPTTKEQCGAMCTDTIGCYGFAHKDNGTCYISKNYILGPSLDSLYSDDYNQADYRCNKFRPMQGFADQDVPEAIKQNAFYTCADNEDSKYGLNVMTNNLSKQLGDFSDIDKIDIPFYEVYDFEWPTKRNQIIKFNHGQSNEHKSNEFEFTIYEKSHDEYIGKNLYEKCINTNEKECLKMCKNNYDCVGASYNNGYCCPKRTVDNIINRNDTHNTYYIKTNDTNFDKSKSKIYIGL